MWVQVHPSVLACSGSADRESQAENAMFAEAEREGGQLAVIEEHDDRADTGSAMSTGKMDPHAPGWTKRIGVGSHPPERTPCSERVCALEKTIGTRRSWVSMLLSPS